MPLINVPRQKSQKLWARIAAAQVTAPSAPASAPSAKPARRPWCCMKSENKYVDSAAPTVYAVIDRVARDLSGASRDPARLPTANTVMVLATTNPWHTDKTTTFLFIVGL